jgi:uncharacterized metal-binding protein YceD (DUF177 family)
MKIPFRKIGNSPQEFELLREGVTFKGTLEHYKRGLIMLDGHIGGTFTLPCDICAENFDTILDEKLDFLLSDGIYSGHDEDFDVVESLDGMIDIDDLLSSELELIRSDYHSCPACQD